MNKFAKFVLMIILVSFSLIPSFAEGGGKRALRDYGINRRVVSKTGYTGVKGTITFSSANIHVPSFPSNEQLRT